MPTLKFYCHFWRSTVPRNEIGIYWSESNFGIYFYIVLNKKLKNLLIQTKYYWSVAVWLVFIMRTAVMVRSLSKVIILKSFSCLSNPIFFKNVNGNSSIFVWLYCSFCFSQDLNLYYFFFLWDFRILHPVYVSTLHFYKQHFNGLKLNIGAKEKNEYIMEYKVCMNNNGMSDTGSGEPLVQPLAIYITN